MTRTVLLHHGHAGRGADGADGSHGAPPSTGRMLGALLLNVGITATEFVVGLIVGSLALIADAFHNLSDVVALGLSYFGVRAERKPPDMRHSFGFGRTEVLVGLGNALALVVITAYIFYEAYRHILHPPALPGVSLLIVGGVGLVGNVASVWLLHGGGGRQSLNVRSAILHLALDALSAIGIMIAALFIMVWGWSLADPVVSILIGVLVLAGSAGLIREGIHILMEGVPKDFDIEALARTMEGVEGVCSVHHIHVWNVSSTSTVMSAHVVIDEAKRADFQPVLETIRRALADTHHIRHTTLEPEIEACQVDGLLCIPPGTDAP
ncbi:MAG: cation transporter [Deltaproteobacteria bacterium]|nr:cation transporter [Deltaproteobacteria bacterium]